jgi:hypothetical protein
MLLLRLDFCWPEVSFFPVAVPATAKQGTLLLRLDFCCPRVSFFSVAVPAMAKLGPGT